MTKHKTFLFIFIGVAGFIILLMAMNISNINSNAKMKIEESNEQMEYDLDLNSYLNSLERDQWLSFDFIPDNTVTLDFRDNGIVAYSLNEEPGITVNYEVADLVDSRYAILDITNSSIPEFSGQYAFSLNNADLNVYDENNNLLGSFQTLSTVNAALNSLAN